MRHIVLNDKLNNKFSLVDEDLSFDVTNGEYDLYLHHLSDNRELEFVLKDEAILNLSIFVDNPLKNLKLRAKLGKNSKIIVYFADFSTEQVKVDALVELNDLNAECLWKLASLSSNKDNKEINVNVIHNHPSTFAKVDNYGVCKDNGKLLFAGTSHISNGCHKSKSSQNAKIVVFDEGCIAKAKPILKIDENDIEASHAAGVGKISDEHIFYLTSRGLKLEEAKMLITLGYLKPILKGFSSEIQSDIDNLINRRLAHD